MSKCLILSCKEYLIVLVSLKMLFQGLNFNKIQWDQYSRLLRAINQASLVDVEISQYKRVERNKHSYNLLRRKITAFYNLISKHQELNNLEPIKVLPSIMMFLYQWLIYQCKGLLLIKKKLIVWYKERLTH